MIVGSDQNPKEVAAPGSLERENQRLLDKLSSVTE